jgi:hypothetical protein
MNAGTSCGSRVLSVSPKVGGGGLAGVGIRRILVQRRAPRKAA